jgi:hypothetical protein
MSGGIFKSNRAQFMGKHEAFKDFVLGHLSMDVEVFIKIDGRTPVKTGGMKAEVRSHKIAQGKWQVVSGKNYSAVQEAGQRNGRKFRKYSTPGTSGGWFKAAIDKAWRNRDKYAIEGKRAVGL